MSIAIAYPLSIRKSQINDCASTLEASPENWSVGDIVTVGGILSGIFLWLWKKPIKLLLDIMKGPGRIELILKKLEVIEAGVSLAASLSRVTWKLLDKPVWQSDATGMCVFCNPSMLALLGRQEDELIGNSWRSIIHEDDRERVMHEWDSAIKDERDFNLSYRWTHANGTSIPITAHASKLTDNEGNRLGYVGFVTALKKH